MRAAGDPWAAAVSEIKEASNLCMYTVNPNQLWF